MIDPWADLRESERFRAAQFADKVVGWTALVILLYAIGEWVVR